MRATSASEQAGAALISNGKRSYAEVFMSFGVLRFRTEKFPHLFLKMLSTPQVMDAKKARTWAFFCSQND